MPTITVSADALNPAELKLAGELLLCMATDAAKAGFTEETGAAVNALILGKVEVKEDPMPPAGANTDTALAGLEAALNGQTATTAASPSEDAATATKGRRTRKAAEDITIFGPDGEKMAGYSHSHMAADRFLFEWKRITQKDALEAMYKVNTPSLARLVKEDIERIMPEMSAHAEAVKSGKVTAEPEPATAELSDEQQLAALFGGGAAPTPETPAMTEEEFAKAMYGLASKMGVQQAVAWLKDEGYVEVKGIPAGEYANMVKKGEARVVELAAMKP